jgi:predicted nucleic acid-binding protein
MALIFLDANILFSAAYRPDAGLRKLWSLPGVRRMTSVYAAEEARRNLSQPKQREDLEELLDSVEIIATVASTGHPLFSTIELPDKDQPILLAAIGAGATYLLTGDFQHFGPYYGERIEGVLILSPGDYLTSRTG